MEPGDKDAIYHAVVSLMEDKNLCKDMGKKSFEKVQVHLPEYVEKQLETLYDSLL